MEATENRFEAGIQKAIPAVLVYLFNQLSHSEEVLMIHRKSRSSSKSGSGSKSKYTNKNTEQQDFHEGKWNGLGGKCELNESPLEAAIREVREESGIQLQPNQLQALGVLQFPNFKPHKNEDWIVFVFHARLDSSQHASEKEKPFFQSAEGDLHWIPKEDLMSLNLWPGDRQFLPWVLERRPFMGTLWYRDSKISRHWIVPLAASSITPS